MAAKKNIFTSAVTKLTLTYTAILAIICIGFSVSFYVGAHNELSRPISTQLEPVIPGTYYQYGDYSFNAIIKQRDAETRTGIFGLLVIVNASVLTLGACISYFLAKWTLQPIQKMTEQQANFISDASHELRTPLTAITMENEVALSGPALTKAELTSLLKSNLEETKKLQSLTDRLLRLSQQEPIPLTPTNLATCANSATTSLLRPAKAKNITIKNTVKSHKILSDPDSLTEIINIILENAIKYSPQKSTITIAYEPKTHEITISDQGPGIAPDDLPHIFNRFYRAEKSRTSHGHGLGLSLAAEIANQLGLKITAKNNPKKGATFTISNFPKA